MLNTKTLNKIKKQAIQIDWGQAFNGTSKGNKHLWRIVGIAKYLGRKEKTDPSIVEAGAWLHDIALPTGNDEDYQKNIQLALDLLKPLEVTKDEAQRIANCVATHEGTVQPKTMEAQIVHDADVLEKVGILGLIRHSWKLTNSGKIDPKNITDENVREIINHIQWRMKQLRTKSAKKLAKTLHLPLSFAETRELIRQISPLAANGIITEKIAQAILPNLSNEQQQSLKKQLRVKKP